MNLWESDVITEALRRSVEIREAAFQAWAVAGEQEMPWLERVADAADKLAFSLKLWEGRNRHVRRDA